MHRINRFSSRAEVCGAVAPSCFQQSPPLCRGSRLWLCHRNLGVPKVQRWEMRDYRCPSGKGEMALLIPPGVHLYPALELLLGRDFIPGHLLYGSSTEKTPTNVPWELLFAPSASFVPTLMGGRWFGTILLKSTFFPPKICDFCCLTFLTERRRSRGAAPASAENSSAQNWSFPFSRGGSTVGSSNSNPGELFFL